MPPLRITALPLFIHKEAESLVTLGRDSYIIPITPIGTRSLPITRPLRLFHILSITPDGSLSLATAEIESAISLMRLLSRVKRSIIAFESFLAFKRSCLFAFIIRLALLFNALAIYKSALFLSSVEALESTLDDALEAFTLYSTDCLKFIFFFSFY